MDPKKMTHLVGQMLELLQPLTPEERQRVISAVFTLLGEKTPAVENQKGDPDTLSINTGPRVNRWLKDYSISQNDIDQWIHLEGNKSQVVDTPGKSAKERAVNAYIFSGVLSFLATGEPKFQDQMARDLCKRIGAYSDKHHATYMQGGRGLWIGTKEAGWTLTAQGLKMAASLLRPLPQQK